MRLLALLVLLLNASGCSLHSGIPETWTHQELADHLAARGTGFKFVAEKGAGLPTGYFVPANFDGGPDAAREALDAAAEGFVQCVQMGTPEDAKKQVRVVGYHGFASGRFTFRSRDDAALSRIRRALP